MPFTTTHPSIPPDNPPPAGRGAGFAANFDAEELSLAYADGESFAGGKYRLGDSLGAGLMGRVFLALEIAAATEVAVKILHEKYRDDESFTARFRAEIALLDRCQHPLVVRLLDSGQDEDSGALFLVMEYMPGRSVHDWIDRPNPPSLVISWLRSAAQALAHAHSLGVYHHDVRPSNLLLTGDMQLRLADFSIAVALPPDSATPGPTSAPAPHAADLHALGALFYQLLTGRPSIVGCLPPSEVTGLPPLCDDIFNRATTARPSRQFSSVAAMDAALARLQRELAHPALPWLRRLAVAAAVLLVLSGALWLSIKQPASVAPSAPVKALPAAAAPGPSPGLAALALLPVAASPADATAGRPFVTASGHYFLPVPHVPGVLLDATETRRYQFQRFADSLDAKNSLRLLPKIHDLTPSGVAPSTRAWTDTCPLPDDAAGGISRWAAVAYADWLTAQEKSAGHLPEGAFFRLPWALEWFAASGAYNSALALGPVPEKLTHSWGRDWPPPVEVGNFAGYEAEADPLRPRTWPILARRDPFPRVAPSGFFKPNFQGFFDMDGNVSEWGRDAASSTAVSVPAHLVLGTSWAVGEPPSHNVESTYDYDTTGVSFRGFRLALQLAEPVVPLLHVTLHDITDCSGAANTDSPGKTASSFRVGEKVRITWRVENFGPPVPAAVIRSNARAGGNGSWSTYYRGPGIEGKSALAGGILYTASFERGGIGWFSFDMDTTGWPATPVQLSSTIHGGEGADAPCLETSAPGAGIPRISGQWWQDGFTLKAP